MVTRISQEPPPEFLSEPPIDFLEGKYTHSYARPLQLSNKLQQVDTTEIVDELKKMNLPDEVVNEIGEKMSKREKKSDGNEEVVTKKKTWWIRSKLYT